MMKNEVFLLIDSMILYMWDNKRKEYLLNGESNELGSIQNPTNAWKKSISSSNGVARTILRRYDLDIELNCRSNLDRIEWHCVRKNSAGGPLIPMYPKNYLVKKPKLQDNKKLTIIATMWTT